MGTILRDGCVQLQQHEHEHEQLLLHERGEHVQHGGVHVHDGLGEDEDIHGEVGGVEANVVVGQLGWLLLVVVAVVAVQLEGEMVQEHDVQVLEYGDS